MDDLRSRLEREGERVGLAPEVLGRVYEGSRRREVRRRLAAGLTATGLTIAVIVWLGVSLIRGDTPSRPTAPATVSIAGTYRATLPATDPLVAELGVAGTYTLALTPNGVIQLETPPAFEEAHESASGDAYRVRGNVVTIGSFTTFSCPGTVGTYRIELSETELRLTPIDEACDLRAVLFGTRPWAIV